MTIPSHLASTIVAHARREQPRECCGLLLGSPSRIADVIPTRNVAEQPDARYIIDPVHHFVAIRLARRRGVQVVGAYHSHVASAARPSPADRDEAFAEFLFLIVSLTNPSAPDLTAWRLDDGNFVPVSLVRTP